jgi:hypothetical protein
MVSSFANGILLPFQVTFTKIKDIAIKSSKEINMHGKWLGTLPTMETIGSICKLPSNLWRKSWCFISSINKLKPQKIKRWCDYLTIGLSTRTKTFGMDKGETF